MESSHHDRKTSTCVVYAFERCKQIHAGCKADPFFSISRSVGLWPLNRTFDLAVCLCLETEAFIYFGLLYFCHCMQLQMQLFVMLVNHRKREEEEDIERGDES